MQESLLQYVISLSLTNVARLPEFNSAFLMFSYPFMGGGQGPLEAYFRNIGFTHHYSLSNTGNIVYFLQKNLSLFMLELEVGHYGKTN